MRLQISDKDEASEKLNKTTNKKMEIFVNENVFRQQRQQQKNMSQKREWKRKRKSFSVKTKLFV